MPFVNNGSFVYFLLIYIKLVSFYCFTVLARLPSIMFNRSSDDGHPYLSPDLRRKINA